MFYGFDERVRNPFNDGLGTEPNEFPLTLVQFQSWWDRTFQDRGSSPFDSQSGLDLGQGFNLNAVIAQVGVQYESYNAVIRMHVTMDSPLMGRHEVKSVQVKGSGLFFDIVGGYEEWSGAIGLARTDAMNAAFNNVFAATYNVIDEWSKTLPLTAVVFGFEDREDGSPQHGTEFQYSRRNEVRAHDKIRSGLRSDGKRSERIGGQARFRNDERDHAGNAASSAAALRQPAVAPQLQSAGAVARFTPTFLWSLSRFRT